MKQIFGIFAFVIFIKTTAFTQIPVRGWHYGVQIVPTYFEQFDWSRGKIDNSGVKTQMHLWGEYRIAGKERGPFTLQRGLRLDMQMLSRQVVSAGIERSAGFYRFPLTWTAHQPRYLKDEKYPLFEMSGAIGPHFTFPYQFESELQQPGYRASAGMYAAFGIEFYIQTGTRLTFNFQTAADLFSLHLANANRADALFFENGFALGVASSIADTRKRNQAMREARKKRLKKN